MSRKLAVSATRWGSLAILTATALTSGCANMNHAQSGAMMGTAMGAALGAAVGSHGGDALPGAVIGGAAGALAGGILGSAEDANIERDRALVQRDAAIIQASHAAQANALTNFDLIRLSQSGLSEDVIINMINTRGGRFDLTTDAVIALKKSGVTDRVIVAAQSAPRAAPPPVVVATPRSPDVIYVEPAPPPIIYHSYGYGHHYHGWHHPRHRGSSVGVAVGF